MKTRGGRLRRRAPRGIQGFKKEKDGEERGRRLGLRWSQHRQTKEEK